MRCNIPNGLSWSFRVIGPNLINPGLHSWKNVNNRNTNTQCRCKRPFTCSPVLAEKKYMFGNDKTSFHCLYRLRKATKKYTHQSLTRCFIEWLAQPPNIHFGLQHWIFPIFARQHLCFGLFMSTCIKLVCFTYVTC